MNNKELNETIDDMIAKGLLEEKYDPERKEMVVRITELGKALAVTH